MEINTIKTENNLIKHNKHKVLKVILMKNYLLVLKNSNFKLNFIYIENIDFKNHMYLNFF